MNGNISLDTRPLAGKLKDFLPLAIHIVNKTPLEPVWDHMVRSHHYLGYQKMFGPRLKYLVLYRDTPIAALSFNRAALRVGVRDRYLGWNQEQKLRLLVHVVNNNRFLILPWVRVRNLASYLLARTLKMLRSDWRALYKTEPFLVETFVDLDKYRGACYQAANWLYLGETRGFAKAGKVFVYHGKRKGVFVYPLNRRFQRIIADDPCRQPNPDTARGRVRNMMLNVPDWSPEILTEIGLGERETLQLGEMLDEYLGYYQDCYGRSDQREHGEIFVKGLLSDLDRKSIEPIVLRYQDGKDVRQMQFFFKNSPWDGARMMHLYQQRLGALASEPDGMISVDGSDFPKKGQHSVGVYRQYCGALGKTENCQSGVFAAYAGSKGYGLVDRRLYLPQAWFDGDHREFWEECAIPADVTFKTKPRLALDMINQALASGIFQARWAGCDTTFGSDQEFLDGLPKTAWFFADVKSDRLVWLERPEWGMPAYKGHGRPPKKMVPSAAPVPVSTIAEDDGIPWRTVVLAEGAKGPIVARVKCLRILECREGREGEELWLYIRRYEDGRTKYSWSNAPAGIAPEKLDHAATLRWPIEQCFEECKSYLGMGHYESRSWAAWHRHMMFVFIAHLFTTEVRMRFKKTPVLTMPQAWRLIAAAFTHDPAVVRKALANLEYYLRRNYVAYRSHRKKTAAFRSD